MADPTSWSCAVTLMRYPTVSPENIRVAVEQARVYDAATSVPGDVCLAEL